jgi:hypothetical protein
LADLPFIRQIAIRQIADAALRRRFRFAPAGGRNPVAAAILAV